MASVENVGCGRGGKLLNGIKSMYFDSSVCVRIKGGKSERFRKDSGVNGEEGLEFEVLVDGIC